jgi:hypothetical protein
MARTLARLAALLAGAAAAAAATSTSATSQPAAAAATSTSATSQPPLVVVVSPAGNYSVTVGGALWYASSVSGPTVCVGGSQNVPLSLSSGPTAASGTDPFFGAWTGTNLTYATTDPTATPVVYTFKQYASQPSVAVLAATFPAGLNTSNCGSNTEQSTSFPSFDTTAGLAPELYAFTWSGGVLSKFDAAVGLGVLSPGGALDFGPVVSYSAPGTVAGDPALVWSTLTSHKIVIQTTTSAPTPGPITSLWSATRQDQIACLSALCSQDQVADGNYTTQRVEGYGIASASSLAGLPRDSLGRALVRVAGRSVPAKAMTFCWSETHTDNFVGTNTTGPDDTYVCEGGNGAIFADGSAPGTVPLQVYTKAYGSRTDWAAVASPAGIAWAQANGYALQFVAGWVWSSPPTEEELGGGAGSSTYSLGLSAAIPAIPAGWSYSVLLSAAYGGATAATYQWGAMIQGFSGTTRAPSVTLEKIGYYTGEAGWGVGGGDGVGVGGRVWPRTHSWRPAPRALGGAGIPTSQTWQPGFPSWPCRLGSLVAFLFLPPPIQPQTTAPTTTCGRPSTSPRARGPRRRASCSWPRTSRRTASRSPTCVSCVGGVGEGKRGRGRTGGVGPPSTRRLSRLTPRFVPPCIPQSLTSE